MLLRYIADDEGSKDAKNMESIKAVSAPDDSILKQAPLQENSNINEIIVSKNILLESHPQQDMSETTTATTEAAIKNNLSNNPKNTLIEQNVDSQGNNESTDRAIEAKEIAETNSAIGSGISNQVAIPGINSVGLSVSSHNLESAIDENKEKERKESKVDDANVPTTSSGLPTSEENQKHELNMPKEANPAHLIVQDAQNSIEEMANLSLSLQTHGVIAKSIKEENTEIELAPLILQDSVRENNILPLLDKHAVTKDIKEGDTESVLESTTAKMNGPVTNVKNVEEVNQQSLKVETVVEQNSEENLSEVNPSSSGKVEEPSHINLENAISSGNSAKEGNAAFTTEINLNIASVIQNSKEETHNDPKNTNIIVIEPKKIYVEKSSTVIQVLDANNAEYVKVGEKLSSASESESGTSDNNEYEFVDASSQNLNSTACEKRAHRSSISTISIMLINNNENTEKVENNTVNDVISVVDDPPLPCIDVENQTITDSAIETVAEVENDTEQYKAVFVPVDKPLGNKLSRKQKKSMRELQKIARERAKTKLTSQLSTSSSESANELKATPETPKTESDTQFVENDVKAENDQEVKQSVKSTTVVQLAQNSSKTVPVPPKRPSKIPISRQRSNSKIEPKSPEQTPSRIPVKTNTSPQIPKATKAPETSNKQHVGDATPEFTNSASIILKPSVAVQKGRKSDDIASEMESSVQIVKDLNRKFSMAQNRSLSKKSSVDSTTSSKQLSYTKSLDNDSDSSVSDSNVEELLEHSSDEDSYEEFDEFEEEIAESDTEDYNNFDRENLRSATELNVNLSQISQKVDELTSNLNHEKRLNYKKPNSYIEETCESSEDYLSEEELEADDTSEEVSEDDIKELTEKLNNDLNVEIKQPTELELMQVRSIQKNRNIDV